MEHPPQNFEGEPDPAFRQTEAGLFVPAGLSRERQVWTADEGRLFERVSKLLTARGLDLFLQCQRPACRRQPLTSRREADGALVLRCGHADRILQRRF